MTSPTLQEAIREVEAINAARPPHSGTGVDYWEAARRDPQHYIELDADNGLCHVYWGGYDYKIELDKIATPEATLGWVQQMGEKTWPLMTPERIVAFISIIANHFGWKTR